MGMARMGGAGRSGSAVQLRPGGRTMPLFPVRQWCRRRL